MTGSTSSAFESRIDSAVPSRSTIRLLVVVVAACALLLVTGISAGTPGDSHEGGNQSIESDGHDVSFENATPIEDGETLTNRSVAADEKDVYAIDLVAGERVDVTTDEQVEYFQIYGPDEKLLETDGTEADGLDRVAMITPENGTYYVTLWPQAGGETSYDISATVGEPIENDVNEPNDDRANATRIEPGERVSDQRLPLHTGYSWQTLETDIFTTNLSADTRLDVSVDGQGTENVDIAIHNGTDGYVVSSEDTDDETVSAVTDHDGTYYIAVGDFYPPNAYYVPSYTLSTNVSEPAPNDDYEPNDDEENATPVAVGETLSDLRVVVDETDTFGVNLSAGQRIDVSAVATDGGTVTLVVNEGGYDTVENGTLTYTAIEDGRYNFSVVNSDQETTDYAFSVEAAGEVENDRFEPNDRIEDAPTVPTGETLTDLWSFGPEEDFYAVEVSEPDVLNVTVSKAGNGSRAAVEIYERNGERDFYGPNGTLIARGADSGNRASVATLVDSPGTYYVRALPESDGVVQYSLSTNVAAYPDNDRFEPNDNVSTAASIATNGTVSDLELVGEEWDYYSVDLREGQRYTVEMVGDDRFSTVGMVARLPDRSLISNGFLFADGGSVTFVAPETATYVVGLQDEDRPSLSYSLRTNVTGKATGDRFEPNDDPANATVIDGNSTLTDLQATGREADVFAVSVNRSQVLRVSLDRDDLNLKVESPNGFEEYADDERISTIAVTSGTYYVSVSNDFSDVKNYTLQTNVSAVANDPYEFNNDRASATPIEVGTNLTGLSLTEPDVDVFEIPATRSDPVRVNTTGSIYRPNLGITDSDGEEVVTAESARGTTFRPVQENPYYVYVGSVYDEFPGEYWLSVSDAENVSDYDPDRLEPNDDRANASNLSTDASPEGLTVVTGDPDYHAVTVSEPTWLNASLDATGEAELDLLDPDHGLPYQYRPDGTTSLAKRVGPGTYYVRVEGQSLDSQEYSLDIETNSDGVGTTMSVDPGSARLSVGESRTMAVTLDAPRGVQAQMVNVSVTNASVAEITGVDLPGEPDVSTVTIGPNNRTAHAEAGYFEGRSGSTSKVLANVTVTATANGTTTLGLWDLSATDASGPVYVVSDIHNATLTVGESTTPAFAEAPPSSLDDDERYEDVDGDGDGDIFDALTYFNNRDNDAIRDNPERYDFDGDGEAGTLFDALALYEEVA